MKNDLDIQLLKYAEWAYLGITVALLAFIFWYGGDDLRVWVGAWF